MMADKSAYEWVDINGDAFHRIFRELWTGPGKPTPDDIWGAPATDDAGFWQEIERIAENCDAILGQRGFPPAGVAIRFSEAGFWCLSEGRPGRAPAGVRVHSVNSNAAYMKRFSEPFSDAWYAGDAGAKCREILNARGLLDDNVLEAIFHLGLALRDWSWKRRYERAITSSRVWKPVGRKGGLTSVANRQAKKDEWSLPVARQFMLENPDALLADLLRHLADWASAHDQKPKTTTGWDTHVKRWLGEGKLHKGTRFP